MTDLPEVSPALEVAVNVAALIQVLENSAVGIETLVAGYESMAETFAEHGVPDAAEALRGGNAALTGHCVLLRSVAATLEPVVTIFHKADQGDE